MRNDIIIRPLQIHNDYEVASVFVNAFRRPIDNQTIQGMYQRITKLSKNDITRFFVATLEDKIVGIGGLTPFPETVYVGFMAVSPSYQKQGIGRKLFEEILQVAKNLGYKRIELYASDAGKPLYEKYGFQSSFVAKSYKITGILKTIDTGEIHVVDKLPSWAYKLDFDTFGYDRTKYLNYLINNGKAVLIENEGYGILTGSRIGPIIAKNSDSAISIIQEAYRQDNNYIRLAKHEYFSSELFEYIEFEEIKNSSNVKMIKDSPIGDYSNLIALHSFASG